MLLTPGLGQRPVPIGTINPQKEDDPFTALIPDSSDFTPYTAVWNVTGQPAISLPLFQGDDGLPTSIQLVGPPIGEELLLSAGAQSRRSGRGRTAARSSSAARRKGRQPKLDECSHHGRRSCVPIVRVNRDKAIVTCTECGFEWFGPTAAHALRTGRHVHPLPRPSFAERRARLPGFLEEPAADVPAHLVLGAPAFRRARPRRA